MILVYSPKLTNRLRYIFRLFFEDILQVSVDFTSEEEVLVSHNGPQINYSNKRLPTAITIHPARLLFETGVTEQELSVFTWEDLPAFFATTKHSALPFDPFAAAFYLVTRFEEYLPHLSDAHSRFHARDSFAYQQGFLRRPVINLWAKKLREVIGTHYSTFSFPDCSFTYTSTVDIDNAYAFREKGLIRTLAGAAKDISKFDFAGLIERIKVIAGQSIDPYDTYAYMLELQKKHQLNCIYFFLLGDYGLNDKNVPVTSKKFQSLIQSLADYATVGIHPSYGSNSKDGQLKIEINRLADITKREISKSRQHFLKLNMPKTYRNLIDCEIHDDYTMGYASEPGFRASICTAYYHYDLDMEQATQLRIHPFAYMDGTLNEYLHLSIPEAIAVVKELMEEVKAVNGSFMSLWHNETLNDRGKWKGWTEVYEKTIEFALN